MWLSPEGRTFGGLMRQYPLYDSAMFLAFLTMVPAIALFTVFVKTEFLDHYRAFYASIEQHGTLAQIRRNHQRIVDSLLAGGRQLLILQVVVSVSVAVLAPAIIELARLHYVQLSIFRLGTLGRGSTSPSSASQFSCSTSICGAPTCGFSFSRWRTWD